MTLKHNAPGEDFAGDEYFRLLYDANADYVARRDPGSFAARQILHEVLAFKIPNLLAVIPTDFRYEQIVEIGCATGELIANFPTSMIGVRRVGYDLSPLNIRAATSRHPHVDFRNGVFGEVGENFDLAILSDVLEHVPDDTALLRTAGERATIVLVNLPLEDNWINRNRRYGIEDPSGHLRAYSFKDGISLATTAGLEVLHWVRVWAHETPFDIVRRRLRKECIGQEFSGNVGVRWAKGLLHWLARQLPPFGRRLYPSNLFFSARRRQ